MAKISEDVRNWLWERFGTALDRSCYIVARREGGFIRVIKNRLMLDMEAREFFELDYPVLRVGLPYLALLGLHNHESLNSLGSSLSCARTAPLGRAVTRLQRRVRFRLTARRYLRRMLEQLRCSSDETNRSIIGYVGAVTLFPRVM